MIAAQSNAPSLAGFLTNLNFEHLVKLSVHQTNICPMFSQLTYLKSQGCKADLKTPDHQKLNEKKDSTANAILSTTANEYQPFGSVPRDCNSFRITRLIQAARDSSPSCCWAASINSLSSGSSLNWNGGLPLRSFLCVDTLVTPIVMYIYVMTHYYHMIQKTMPRSGGTLAGHLTTTDTIIIEVAEMDHTTHPKGRHSVTQNSGAAPVSFVWIIAAVRRDCPTVKATIHHIAAATEREARRTLAKDHVCFFAGRIRQGVSHA